MYQKDYQSESNRNTTEYMILNDMTSNIQHPGFNSDLVFTPTTLANFESSLGDLHCDLMTTASQATGTSALGRESAASRLWASESSEDDDDEYDDESSNSIPTEKMQKLSGNSKQTTAGLAKSAPDSKPPRKLPGPRPSRRLEDMTPLEAERRRRRRERNKSAAAKCRQRRIDVTNELLAETELLEREAAKLEQEIENLRRQKNQLEFVLESHKPVCNSSVHGLRPTAVQIKQERTTPPTTLAAPNQFVSNSAARPTSLPISTSGTSTSIPTTLTSSVLGSIFSFDPSTSLTGLTPMFSTGESPSSYLLLSPTTLLSQPSY